ncbi:MAG: hypothetical protein II186_04965, partial [Erysipelotrichales bacterium]|nr:hypothetical protein [Erysipelotrichales bacterium]
MGQFFKKALKVLLSVLMTFSLIHTSGVTRTVKAAVGDEPAHSKSLIDNHDGTYTLALSVTGDSEKNPPKTYVIVILDTSGSMEGNTGSAGYEPTNSTDNGLYGFVNGQYVSLTRQGGYWQGYTFWYNGEQYTGQRYNRKNNADRLDVAKQAIRSLSYSLLSLNGATNEDGTTNPGDLFEMALI